MRVFEFHDQHWFPAVLRDYVTDDLQAILNVVNLCEPIVPRLRQALAASHAKRVVDLCSGAGGPWPLIYPQIRNEDEPGLNVLLTDKFPNVDAITRESGRLAHGLSAYPAPVDATHIPTQLAGFRTIFNSFHHFRGDEARAMLKECVDKNEGIGVFEVPGRYVMTMALVLLIPFADWIIVPLVSPFAWRRFIFTYLIPVVPFVLLIRRNRFVFADILSE